MVRATDQRDCNVYTRIEPRTRKEDFATALSFEVYDPLWMLTRQWQFGRFKGNDCGSIVTSKVKVSRRRLDRLYSTPAANMSWPYSTDTPMEYDVEKRNRPITPFIRIESALHFKKMAGDAFTRKQTATPPFQPGRASLSDTPAGDTMEEMMRLFPLEEFIPFVEDKDKTIETLKTEQNTSLKGLYATYGKRIFDGYKLFCATEKEIASLARFGVLMPDRVKQYKAWFAQKYLPLANEEDSCWNEQKMGYQTAVSENENVYEAEDYHTGKLSWYSFDARNAILKTGVKEEKMLSYLPVPAWFPGAPNRRLWEFEDASVQFGHQSNSDFSLLSNAVVMQYASMYSNDWMLTPLEAEAGTVLDVEGIVITDTFGERIFIDTTAEQTDEQTNNTAAGIAFTDRWNLFGTTLANAYQSNDFRSQGGLLFPPTLPRCEESQPLEEVQFLRDEMANMLWGVETVIADGCDGRMAGKDLSDAVLSVVDAARGESAGPEDPEQPYAYSYLVQNRVPLHWIPFIPQKIDGEIREIRFRRGRMPIFFNDSYNPVRPSTELLGIKKRSRGIQPRYINEEEVTGYGVKLVLTAQRTRWFLGRSYTWTGAKKVISQYQANSGLMFDELIDKKSNQKITLREDKENQEE